jgi:hypothetical protein
MSCKLTRFAFINFTKEQYLVRKAKTEDALFESHKTRSNILRWFEDHEKNSSIYEGTIRIQKRRPKKMPKGWTYRQVRYIVLFRNRGAALKSFADLQN